MFPPGWMVIGVTGLPLAGADTVTSPATVLRVVVWQVEPLLLGVSTNLESLPLLAGTRVPVMFGGGTGTINIPVLVLITIILFWFTLWAMVLVCATLALAADRAALKDVLAWASSGLLLTMEALLEAEFVVWEVD